MGLKQQSIFIYNNKLYIQTRCKHTCAFCDLEKGVNLYQLPRNEWFLCGLCFNYLWLERPMYSCNSHNNSVIPDSEKQSCSQTIVGQYITYNLLWCAKMLFRRGNFVFRGWLYYLRFGLYDHSIFKLQIWGKKNTKYDFKVNECMIIILDVIAYHNDILVAYTFHQ